MAKSAGNSFLLSNIEGQAIDPLAFRYLCMTARYRSRVNFTFTALKAAQRALLRLYNLVWMWSSVPAPAPVDGSVVEEWSGRFLDRINDNLDLPRALALTWQLVRSDLPVNLKLKVLLQYDKVLGLGLDTVPERFSVPAEVAHLSEKRSRLRQEARYQEADALRARLDNEGYVVADTPSGTLVRPKTKWERRQEQWSSISSSSEVSSLVDETDTADFTVGIVACNYLEDVRRCVGSALRWLEGRQAEVLVVDNGSADGTSEWLEETAGTDSRVRVIHTDHVLGEGAAKTVVLRQSRGKIVVLLDTSVEVSGDIFGPIQSLLADETIGVAGPFGLRTPDLHHFHDGEGEAGDMDAMQAYCFAFKRRLLKDVGFMRESFRFYRNLDLDYSFHFKDRGYRVVADPTLPVRLHEHRVWTALAEGERDELSRKNYGRFLDKWGDRADLLVINQPSR